MKRIGLFLLFSGIVFSCSKLENTRLSGSHNSTIISVEELSTIAYGKFFPLSKTHIKEITSYAISENFYVQNFNPGFIIAYYDSLNFQPLVLSDDGRYQNGTTGYKTFDMCIESVMENFKGGSGIGPQITDDHYVGSTTHSEYAVEPLCTAAWHQHEPFNWFCSNPFNDNIPAGCVPISILQAMQVYSYPNEIDLSYLDGRTIQLPWDDMPSSWFYPTQTDESIAVAHLTREVGERVNVTYGEGGSSAYMENVHNCLASLNYSSSYLTDYSLTAVISSINASCPVIISGQDTNNEGHAWLVDGYREETDSTKWSLVGSRHLPFDAGYELTKSWYLHFNFGWGGMDNTYFLSRKEYYGDCDMLINSPISETLVSMFSGDFTNNCRVITNIKPNDYDE